MTSDQKAFIDHKIAELRRKEKIAAELLELITEIVMEQLTINDDRRDTLLHYLKLLKEK